MNDIQRLSADTRLQFDHLVIAASSLKVGVEYLEGLLQVPLQQGGQHEKMGTHNALLRLGTNCYLEVIAIDQSLPKPQRIRWFGLDCNTVRKHISEKPRLLHWVVRTTDFSLIHSKIPQSLGRIIDMSRGDLCWKITVPDDGTLPAKGILPSVIQWLSTTHPASRLPDQGCSLSSLEATLPDVDSVQRQISTMGLQDIIKISQGSVPQLKAIIQTPHGKQVVV